MIDLANLSRLSAQVNADAQEIRDNYRRALQAGLPREDAMSFAHDHLTCIDLEGRQGFSASNEVYRKAMRRIRDTEARIAAAEIA